VWKVFPNETGPLMLLTIFMRYDALNCNEIRVWRKEYLYVKSVTKHPDFRTGRWGEGVEKRVLKIIPRPKGDKVRTRSFRLSTFRPAFSGWLNREKYILVGKV
jgi:hypothetical protein